MVITLEYTHIDLIKKANNFMDANRTDSLHWVSNCGRSLTP